MSDSPSQEGRSWSWEYEAIREVIRQRDTRTLAQVLEAAKKNRRFLPVGAGGETLLHVAASKPEYKDCLALMLQHREGILRVDAETRLRATALFVACREGLDESALLLLQAGSEPNTRYKCVSETSPLYVATKKGYSKIVEYLLDFGANLKEATYGSYMDLLHVAAKKKRLDVCRILLEKGAIMKKEDAGGRIPLHYMLEAENFEDTRFVWNYVDFSLLNHGDRGGVTPFMLAVRHWDARGVRYLLENAPKIELYCEWTPQAALHEAAKHGSDEVFQLLLRRTDVAEYTKFCSRRHFAFSSEPKWDFVSLTNCALECPRPAEKLNLLVASGLPKCVLQMPSAVSRVVYSPLARLRWSKPAEECLRLLIEHEVLMLDEFNREFHVNWQQNCKFYHPFTGIFEWCESDDLEGEASVTEKVAVFFNLLCANGVTTDYCLQSYHDTAEPFATFDAYSRYYEVVIRAVKSGNVEAVKSMMSNSVILEPDTLLMLSAGPETNSDEFERRHRDACRFLISLKPFYYMREKLQRYGVDRSWILLKLGCQDELAEVTLQQLCRTAIREQLREPSLEDNLRNFRRKILELPLPNSLKDYLLFKC